MGNFMSSYNAEVHVVVVGAGYAGVLAAKSLDSKVRVTLVESADSFNHKIASLRAVVVPGWEKRTHLPLQGLLRNGRVIQAEVQAADTGRVVLSDQSVIECNFVILAHGNGAPTFPGGSSHDINDTASYEAKARTMQQTIAAANSVLLVGGGAVGVELAGEIAAHHPAKRVTLVHSGHTLLSNLVVPLPAAATAGLHNKLVESGVQVVLNERFANTPVLSGGESYLHTPGTATQYQLSNGDTVSADLYIDCTGTTRRTGNLVPPAHLDERNLVKVQPDLQVVGMPGVFCIGGANNVREDKQALFACCQAVTAAANVHKLVYHKPTMPYSPSNTVKTIVTVGPHRGAGAVGRHVLGDRIVSKKIGKDLFVREVYRGFGLPVPQLTVVN